MRDFFYAFKSSCLFVGTVIGAGFATGEEIKLYFGGTDMGSVCLSALFFGVFSALFMIFGKIKMQKNNKKSFWSFAWILAKNFALIVSFWAVFVSLVVSSFACCIAIFAGIVMAFCGVVGSGYALVGGAIAGTGVTMLLAVGFYWLCIYMSKATAWFFRKREKRGEQDERD